MADTRENARLAFDLFVQTYQPKYPKAAECLNKDNEALLTFYDFPAEPLFASLNTIDKMLARETHPRVLAVRIV